MARLEDIMFRKLDLWIVGLLMVLGALATIAFGALVYDNIEGSGRSGLIGKTAVLVAKSPWTLKEVMSEDLRAMTVEPNRFKGSGGWHIEPGAQTGALPGYVLLSRHDGDRRRHVVEMFRLSDLSLVYRWQLDVEQLLADARRDWTWMDYTSWRHEAWRAIHPLLLNNGDLIVKDHYSPLLRVTPCGERVWIKQDVHYHHSTEPDGEGAFWIPTLATPSMLPGTKEWFLEDTLTRMTSEGEILFRRSLVQTLIDHGLYHRIFAAMGFYANDPLHLNDIQPVLEDGPYWRRGDLFLSLRRYSTLLLYRPSTDEILWAKEGPWIAQHDVDIVDDHRIAVFSNNAIDTGTGPRVRDVSEVLFYDFATDAVTSPFRDAMVRESVRTLTEGLADLLPSGHLMLEEQNAGRLLLFSLTGELVASYINHDSDGRGFQLGWSRYIPQTLGATAAATLKRRVCETFPAE
ncbi:MAG: hypothetical protein C1943_12750 [Halochromatium sp.]|nr:hypothetical protein [Halochromatium sp.]